MKIYTDNEKDTLYSMTTQLGDLFMSEVLNDDESNEAKGEAMFNAYFNVSEEGKEAIDNMLIAVCGYSFDSLINKIL